MKFLKLKTIFTSLNTKMKIFLLITWQKLKSGVLLWKKKRDGELAENRRMENSLGYIVQVRVNCEMIMYSVNLIGIRYSVIRD